MRFKRPQVRYADTPQPATPYQAAGQVWDERIGSPACRRRTGG
jgi:type IV secretory pathway TrbF-like protein